MSERNYFLWDAEGMEKTPLNEAEDIQALADMVKPARNLNGAVITIVTAINRSGLLSGIKHSLKKVHILERRNLSRASLSSWMACSNT